MNKLIGIPGLIICLALLFQACQEEYFAKLDNLEPFLVVDGLITDKPGPHKVRLSLSGRFQEEMGTIHVSDAHVMIEAGDGVITEMMEDPWSPGTYLTPADFRGLPGNTYILHIETAEGEVYQSKPQRMNDPVIVDSVFIEQGKMVFYRQSNVSNAIYRVPLDGYNVFFQSDPGNGEEVYFRFQTLNYMQWVIPLSDVSYLSCWWQWDVSSFFGSDLGKSSRNEPGPKHIGFLPMSSNDYFYFGYNLTDDSLKDAVVHSARVLTNRIYTLNNESYAFHKSKNDQLNNEGRFFDPIASQPYGNMICISDPGKMALGIFEVSAEVSFTHRLISNFIEGTRYLELLDPFNPQPSQGHMFTGPPNFARPEWWID
jgi:hypothetical protein